MIMLSTVILLSSVLGSSAAWSDTFFRYKQISPCQRTSQQPLYAIQVKREVANGSSSPEKRIDVFAHLLDGIYDEGNDEYKEEDVISKANIANGQAIFDNDHCRISSSWFQRYQEWKDFESSHGHGKVDRKSNMALYLWIKAQREWYDNVQRLGVYHSDTAKLQKVLMLEEMFATETKQIQQGAQKDSTCNVPVKIRHHDPKNPTSVFGSMCSGLVNAIEAQQNSRRKQLRKPSQHHKQSKENSRSNWMSMYDHIASYVQQQEQAHGPQPLPSSPTKSSEKVNDVKIITSNDLEPLLDGKYNGNVKNGHNDTNNGHHKPTNGHEKPKEMKLPHINNKVHGVPKSTGILSKVEWQVQPVANNHLNGVDSNKVDLDTSHKASKMPTKKSPTSTKKDKKPQRATVTKGTIQKSWLEMFNMYQKFAQEYGPQSKIPRSEYPKLSEWVSRQRQWYKSQFNSDNKGSRLIFLGTNAALEKIKMLEQVGFQWNVAKKDDITSVAWRVKYQELMDQVQDGKDQTDMTSENDNKSLYLWIHDQHIWYQKHHDVIFDDSEKEAARQKKISLLRQTGIDWMATTTGVPQENKNNKASSISSAWYQRYEELNEFYKQFGHSNVPRKWTGNPCLGEWVSTQRRWYNNNIGNEFNHPTVQKKLNLMTDIEFQGTPNINGLNQNFRSRFDELCAYKESYGHMNVPSSKNKALSSWIQSQRKWYKEQMKNKVVSKVGKERINMLEGLGFDWSKQHCYQSAIWYGNYQSLCDLKATGNSDTEGNEKLNSWIKTQRAWYKKHVLDQNGSKRKVLSPANDDRLNLLDRIGFDWDSPNQIKIRPEWKARYHELCDYVERFGNADVPPSWDENKPLARWVTAQRTWYKKIKESDGTNRHQEKIMLMEQIGFEWEKQAKRKKTSVTKTWLKKYEELCGYFDQFGNSNVPYKWEENESLARWVRTQRKWYKDNVVLDEDGNLPNNDILFDRVKLLDKIGFHWSRPSKKSPREK